MLSILRNLDVSRMELLKMHFDGFSDPGRLVDFRLLANALPQSLTSIDLSSDSGFWVMGDFPSFHAEFAAILSCHHLEHVKITLPDMTFKFNFQTLHAIFSAWRRIRTLSISFHPADFGIDIRHIIPIIGHDLVSLHLPYISTFRRCSDERFIFNSMRPTRLYRLSSDHLLLQHNQFDVAWELTRCTHVTQGAVGVEDLPFAWVQIYDLIDVLTQCDKGSLVDWLTRNWNVVYMRTV